MQHFDLDAFSAAELIGLIVGGIIGLFISNLVQTLVVKYATSWSANMTPKFWRSFWFILLISIITTVFGELINYVGGGFWIGMLVTLVIAVALIKLWIKGAAGETMNYGNAIVVTVIWYVSMLLIGFAIGAFAVVFTAA